MTEKFDYEKWTKQLREKIRPKPVNILNTLLNKARIKKGTNNV